MGPSEQGNYRLPSSNPDKDHFVLCYDPRRAVVPGKIQTYSSSSFHSFLLLAMLTGMGLLGFFLSVWTSDQLYFWLFVLLMIPVLFLELCKPTHLELTDQGLRIHCLHDSGGLFVSSPWIAWESVLSVDYCIDATSPIKQEKGRAEERWIEIILDRQLGSEVSKWVFGIICLPITRSSNETTLTLRFLESGFFHELDRRTLHCMFLKYLPENRLGEKFNLDSEQLGEIPTYTAIWLDSLHAPNVSSSTLPEGTTLANGQYRITTRLGSGGQSVVYDAICQTEGHDERCVLKEFVLPIRGGLEIKDRSIKHVRNEAELLQSLDHPYIVKYRDMFIEGPRAYLVLEKINGLSLRRIVEQYGPLAQEQVITIGVELCALLYFLHSRIPPIVHRDFTPDNLILGDDSHVRLVDFNVAQRLESTATTTVVGKHAYIPPEQFRGKPTTQSDIYALGASLYFLLVGDDPEPISKADPRAAGAIIDNQLATIISHATEPLPSMRYSSVQEIQSDLLQLDSTVRQLNNDAP